MSSPRSLCCHGILPAFATTWLTRYLPQPWTGSRTQRQQKELVRLQYLRLSEGRGPWTRSSQRRLVDYADSLRRLPRRALASELDLHGRDLDGKLRRRARRRNDFPRLMREARRMLLEMRQLAGEAGPAEPDNQPYIFNYVRVRM